MCVLYSFRIHARENVSSSQAYVSFLRPENWLPAFESARQTNQSSGRNGEPSHSGAESRERVSGVRALLFRALFHISLCRTSSQLCI